jgi:hypothetical protein
LDDLVDDLMGVGRAGGDERSEPGHHAAHHECADRSYRRGRTGI